MRSIVALCLLLLSTGLLGAAPSHVLTADYWAGYAGTKTVPASSAARWLSWVETDPSDSLQIAPLGVKTLLYSDPNRVMPGDAMYTPNEQQYAHNCQGLRVAGERKYKGLVLTDSGSPALASTWRYFIRRHYEAGRFTAVFDDEAVGNLEAQDSPCGFQFDSWLHAHNALIRSIGYPVVYNGLRDYYQRGVAREIALNQSAAGGMMEECYAQVAAEPRVGGWQWEATEETELRMARDRKLFFCYGRDLTPAENAYSGRLYTYASFLLTYDPNTSIIWEYYKTPSGAHVMPESQLVAWNPVVRSVSQISRLRTGGGVYVREYRTCFIAGKQAGPCVAAVNPDSSPHPLDLRGYRRTLGLHGSGVFDGGSARIENAAPPGVLQPLQGIIAFR